MEHFFYGVIFTLLVILVFGIIKYSWGAGAGYRSIICPFVPVTNEDKNYLRGKKQLLEACK